ncbi:15586_t:CDS:2, partial [Dentiscutata erythropus]
QATPLNIRSFTRDEGCEHVLYPPEILVPLPYLKKCLSTIKGSAVYPDNPQYYDCIRVANFTSINISYYSEQVEVVFMSLSKVSKNLSENITPYLAVMAESSGYYTVSITATYLGPAEEARIAVKELIELSNPVYTKFEEMTWWRSVMETFTQQQTVHPVFPPQPFKSTSYNIPLPGLSREGIRFLVNFISNVECTTVALFDVYAGGGVLSGISGNSSAYIHRNLLFVMQLEMKLSDRDKETRIRC